MGHKVNPIAFRIGVNKSINSVWYTNPKAVGRCVHEDAKIRQLVNKNMANLFIDNIIIKRIRDSITVIVYCVKNPSLIRGGENIKGKVHRLIENEIGKSIVFQVNTIRNYDLSAKYHAHNMAKQIAGNVFYKRAMRRVVEVSRSAGALGVKVVVSGRLGGSEMSRVEKQYEGSIPLHSISASVSYARVDTHTTAGIIGIKVWINKPNYIEKKNIRSRRDVHSKREKISQTAQAEA